MTLLHSGCKPPAASPRCSAGRSLSDILRERRARTDSALSFEAAPKGVAREQLQTRCHRSGWGMSLPVLTPATGLEARRFTSLVAEDKVSELQMKLNRRLKAIKEAEMAHMLSARSPRGGAECEEQQRTLAAADGPDVRKAHTFDALPAVVYGLEDDAPPAPKSEAETPAAVREEAAVVTAADAAQEVEKEEHLQAERLEQVQEGNDDAAVPEAMEEKLEEEISEEGPNRTPESDDQEARAEAHEAAAHEEAVEEALEEDREEDDQEVAPPTVQDAAAVVTADGAQDEEARSASTSEAEDDSPSKSAEEDESTAMQKFLPADAAVRKAIDEGVPQAINERVQVRAYFLWKETGCTDSGKNYFEALRTELAISAWEASRNGGA
eukprot:TRINITY_DN115491_c0_g1_i1.p1 TRINITY_DN115491_c0_g1~~TRINITY_DN115491_c0_g1_i1.p1  ORF type:complete len:382 (-),score=128.27 TRINITY_DN115491_c0_g1_i1:323-1468(-)